MKLKLMHFDRSYIFDHNHEIVMDNIRGHNRLWCKLGGDHTLARKRTYKIFDLLADMYDISDNETGVIRKSTYYDFLDDLYEVTQNIVDKSQIKIEIPKGTKLQFYGTTTLSSKDYIIVYLQFSDDPVHYPLYVQTEYLDGVELTEHETKFVIT